MSDNILSAQMLEKGERVSLEKLAAETGLDIIDFLRIGLGWDEGDNVDIDLLAIMVGADGKAKVPGLICFILATEKGAPFQSPEGAVKHTGDNLTGAGAGDDETMTIDLPKVPADIEKVIFFASIYKAAERNQTFGQIDNAVVNVYTRDAVKPVKVFELTEDHSRDRTIQLVTIYRRGAGWSFSADGKGQKEGLEGILPQYGINVK